MAESTQGLLAGSAKSTESYEAAGNSPARVETEKAKCTCSRKKVFPFWFCCKLFILSWIVIVSFCLLAGAALLWNKIDDYFGIVDDVNDVICSTCVKVFTYSVGIIGAFGIVAIFVLAGCCAYKAQRVTIGTFTMYVGTIAALLGIVLVVTEPIWFTKNNDILHRYKQGSAATFLTQILSFSPYIEVWNSYQIKFHCCGVQGYQDYELINDDNSVPTSCCNVTTLPDIHNCTIVAHNVTKADVDAYKIYSEGCPDVIIKMLHLNETSVHIVGIVATASSVFVLVSSILISAITLLVVPEDSEQMMKLLKAMLLGLLLVVALFFKKK